jgi:ribose transport system permease protein
MSIVSAKTTAASLAPRAIAHVLKILGETQAAQAVIALLALVIVAVLTSPLSSNGSRIFLEPGNLTDILRQVSLIGIISLGMTFVILTGGIDLSVGSVLALSSAVLAAVLTRAWPETSAAVHMASAIAVTVVACGAAGAVNGLIIARLRMPPFIVTLASMIGVRGLAKWFTRNENIDIGFGKDVAAQFAAIFRDKIVVIGSYTLTAAVFWLLLSKTVFGRHVRAIGDNPTAAVYAGLPIARTQTGVYALSGLLAGMAGVLYAAENHQGNPNAGIAYELDAIAAVVIGGTRLSGGQGAISGTIIGTLIMGVLTNLLRLNNVDSNVEMMIKAVIIVLAVAVQRARRP